MSFRYIADTYAWVAYFNKKRFKGIIENEIIETPTIVIAEIVRTFKRKGINKETINKVLQFISNRGLILPLGFEEAKRGGEVAEEEKLSLTDGIIYSYLHDENDKLLTGDEHLKDKRDVIFEKE